MPEIPEIPLGPEPILQSIFETLPPAPLRWYDGISPNRGASSGFVHLTSTLLIEDFTLAWRALAEWTRQWNIAVILHGNAMYSSASGDRRVRLPSIMMLVPTNAAFGGEVDFSVYPCFSCGSEVPLGELECPSCHEDQFCDRCGTFGSNLVLDQGFEDNERTALCVGCSQPCSVCSVRSAYHFCATHANGSRYYCVSCGDYTDDGSGATYTDYHGGVVCAGCVPQHCDGCDRMTSYLNDGGFCEDCEDRHITREATVNQGTEEFEEEEKLEREMFVTAIPGRENIRRCGIEIEGGGNWSPLGRKLYDGGLTASAHLGEYHQATSNGTVDLWSLERDGSVDWELVSPPINLADVGNVRQLRTVLKCIREEVKEGNVYLDMRCGLHIHVGAERTAIGGAFNLGTLWGYLEDVIFRLGAAKWPKHRAIVNGVHYCRPTLKGAKTRLEFGLQLEDQHEGRYNALSFNNYIRAMSRSCTCGAARYDSWDQCICNLGKCTFEFRVFNTSANMHKIHAYLALCQALVAYATNLPDLDVDAFPPQEFAPKLVDEMGTTVRELVIENWKPRLSFLFNELPLTDPEKADLLYCVRSSELSALGDEFIDSLAPTNAQEVLV